MSMYYPDEEDCEEFYKRPWICAAGTKCQEPRLCRNCYHKGKYSCPHGWVGALSDKPCESYSCKYLKAETMSVRCIKEEK